MPVIIPFFSLDKAPPVAVIGYEDFGIRFPPGSLLDRMKKNSCTLAHEGNGEDLGEALVRANRDHDLDDVIDPMSHFHKTPRGGMFSICLMNDSFGTNVAGYVALTIGADLMRDRLRTFPERGCQDFRDCTEISISMEINAIHIVPDCRGKGYGRRMVVEAFRALQDVLSHAKERMGLLGKTIGEVRIEAVGISAGGAALCSRIEGMIADYAEHEYFGAGIRVVNDVTTRVVDTDPAFSP